MKLLVTIAAVLFSAVLAWNFWPQQATDRKVNLPINDAFEYPFLGRIEGHSKLETVAIGSADGKALISTNVKVFYAKDGTFLRAELTKANPRRSIEYPISEIQEVMGRENMIVTGLPTPPKMSLPEILTRVNKGASQGESQLFGGAAKMNVTRVNFKWGPDAVRSVFIVNVWDTDDGFFSSINKGRYVFDEDGKGLFSDNVL